MWEYERGTAGLLLSGRRSLGAPASQTEPALFSKEDRLQVDTTVPLVFPVSGASEGEVPTSGAAVPGITAQTSGRHL